ncbi:MAG: DUF1579 family protein [Akkermansiaceae bacterium]|nr:DUF1579 family protein [Akkermansiaceae bacterium]
MHPRRLILPAVFVFALAAVSAEEDAAPKPAELEFLKSAVGVWDARIEVWAQGPEAPPIKFEGVETNRAYGDHWLSSDFESEFQGQTMKVHSIVGYDREKKRMTGMIIDDGPYAARMTGVYDKGSQTVHWKTVARGADGTPMFQETSVTQQGPDQRVLELAVSGEKEGPFTKFMRIEFVRRK